MSGHVAPHRWADLWAGRVDDDERVMMERHAQRCRACARVRHRVTRASDSFATIRTQSSPEVPWDAIRARVHWSVSTERRAALRRRRPAWGWLAVALASGIGVGVLSGGAITMAPARQPIATRVEPPAAVAPAPAPLIGLVSRASGDVMINGLRPQDLFARTLTQGNRIATGGGRVDIQFGEGSAFALGPRSIIELRRFDSEAIELVIDGTVDIAVAPRPADQRFVVHAGPHAIEVRGTRFRVSRDGAATSVACQHGLVAVSDGTARVEVGARRSVRLAGDRPLSSEQVVALSDDDAAALSHVPPLALPLWDPAALPNSSAPLEIATSGHRDVRVDGVELGLAPLRVRVMPGRHTVEAADAAGRYRRAGWVDVTAAPGGARLEIPAEPPPTGGFTERRRYLRSHIDRKRIARCIRSIAKAGLTDTYVQIEISVDAQGAVRFLNVIDTDLPSATSSCVREVLAEVRFGRGADATWRERIDL
jgi:hypothetical protein